VEDRAVVLLQEIRDLLLRSVGNQEQVLRANDESMRVYKRLARRQTVVTGIALAFLVFVILIYVAILWRK